MQVIEVLELHIHVHTSTCAHTGEHQLVWETGMGFMDCINVSAPGWDVVSLKVTTVESWVQGVRDLCIISCICTRFSRHVINYKDLNSKNSLAKCKCNC